MDTSTLIALVGVILGVPATILATLQILDRYKKPRKSQSTKIFSDDETDTSNERDFTAKKRSVCFLRIIGLLSLFFGITFSTYRFGINFPTNFIYSFLPYASITLITLILNGIILFWSLYYVGERKQGMWGGWLLFTGAIIIINIFTPITFMSRFGIKASFWFILGEVGLAIYPIFNRK